MRGEALGRRAVLGGALGLIGLGGRARGDDGVDVAGRWEGTALFANGWQGRVEVTLGARGADGAWSGPYALTVQDEEGPARPRGGTVALRLDGERLVEARVPGPRTVELTGRLAPAGSHAEAALVGTFRDGDQAGAFVLWRYRGR